MKIEIGTFNSRTVPYKKELKTNSIQEDYSTNQINLSIAIINPLNIKNLRTCMGIMLIIVPKNSLIILHLSKIEYGAKQERLGKK